MSKRKHSADHEMGRVSESPVVIVDDRPRKKPTPPKLNFHSKELEELLNVVDDLRCNGISQYIDLPQLIVCGDQSSGKSSVLEALSGLRFPTKDNLCTRFATEMVLRRSHTVSSTITIIPDSCRAPTGKTQLSKFKTKLDVLEDFGSIILEAGSAMGLDKGVKVFSNDILRIELSGPTLPHLTLVDLPGLFHTGNRSQSDDDAEIVKSLVTGYMEKSRSIILAVVSAKNDYANQIVTKYAKIVDPDGKRTLGIITKPDTLHVGSESEQQFVELAKNKDVPLRLGWHVLKNRDYNTREYSAEQRDHAETEFLSNGVWGSLKRSHVGVEQLKLRLSTVLRNQILQALPGLVDDVEKGIKDCNHRLAFLGDPRTEKSHEKLYLYRVIKDYEKLVVAAVEGRYDDDHFGKEHGASVEYRRLRATVQNILDNFRKKMTLHGHQYEIVDDKVDIQQKHYPIKIERTERLKDISRLLKRNRGQELPGIVTQENITALFREQCVPWKNLAEECAKEIYEAAYRAVHAAVRGVADKSTQDGILRIIIDPALEDIRKKFNASIHRVLHQHVSGKPATFTEFFTKNVQKASQRHEKERLEEALLKALAIHRIDKDKPVHRDIIVTSLAKHLASTLTQNMDDFSSSETLSRMEAYYKVAIANFIDDFGVHAVEQSLLDELPKILEPERVLSLDEKTIGKIAAETEESKVERDNTNQKLVVLTEASRVLRRLDNYQLLERDCTAMADTE